jgi:pilus assembly protein CpaE
MPEKPRILVVDQDHGGGTEIQQLLANSPFIVVGGVASDEEALSLASALKPQIIFLALEAHTVLGQKALRELANVLPSTAIVTYSGSDDPHALHQSKALGANEHLTKPLSLQELTSCIARASRGLSKHDGLDEPPTPDNPAATILTIFGPKGGIGKTLIAINLATSMAEVGLAPVLVDMDFASGDIARRMRARAERGLLDAIRNSAELDELTVDSYLEQHPSGVKILPAPREPTDWREINPEAVDRLLALLAKVHQFIIIDTPATFTDQSVLAVRRADDVLLLTSLDPSSMEAAAIALKMLNSSQPGAAKTRLTLNHLTPSNSLSDADAAEQLAHDLFWSLPYDEGIAHRDEAGRPAVICSPKARISRSISEMALSLAEARLPASGGRVGADGPRLLSRLFANPE